MLEQTRHVAKLARLTLDENRLQTLAVQLEQIFHYIAQIDQLDVSGVQPMAHAAAAVNVLREDIVEPSLSVEQVLQNAPETDGRFFKVPKVIGSDDDSAG